MMMNTMAKLRMKTGWRGRGLRRGNEVAVREESCALQPGEPVAYLVSVLCIGRRANG